MLELMKLAIHADVAWAQHAHAVIAVQLTLGMLTFTLGTLAQAYRIRRLRIQRRLHSIR